MSGQIDLAAVQLTLQPIGVVRCSHAEKIDAPRQPAAASTHEGTIELTRGRNFEHALEDLAQWERIWIIFWFHRNEGWRPKVLPPRSADGRKGVFATRAPHRPNPLGLSVLRLTRVEGLTLHVRDLDVLDGTPVLDIKPYVAYTDAFPAAQEGWLASTRDPLPAFAVIFTALAQEQLAWIETHGAQALRARIHETLTLGPQPHPYRRIRPLQGGLMQLAVRDWRVRFRVLERSVEVLEVMSGYRRAQLLAGAAAADPALALHARFVARYAGPQPAGD